jgi:hypothetical protein
MIPVDMFNVDKLIGVIVPVDMLIKLPVLAVMLVKLPVLAVKILVLMILELVILEKKPLSLLNVLTLSICLIDALSTLIINDDKMVDIPKISLNLFTLKELIFVLKVDTSVLFNIKEEVYELCAKRILDSVENVIS